MRIIVTRQRWLLGQTSLVHFHQLLTNCWIYWNLSPQGLHLLISHHLKEITGNKCHHNGQEDHLIVHLSVVATWVRVWAVRINFVALPWKVVTGAFLLNQRNSCVQRERVGWKGEQRTCPDPEVCIGWGKVLPIAGGVREPPEIAWTCTCWATNSKLLPNLASLSIIYSPPCRSSLTSIIFNVPHTPSMLKGWWFLHCSKDSNIISE